MNQLGVRWQTLLINNQVVRFKYNLPVKFKLEELPPYTIYGRDSVYMQPDSAITFKGRRFGGIDENQPEIPKNVGG